MFFYGNFLSDWDLHILLSSLLVESTLLIGFMCSFFIYKILAIILNFNVMYMPGGKMIEPKIVKNTFCPYIFFLGALFNTWINETSLILFLIKRDL